MLEMAEEREGEEKDKLYRKEVRKGQSMISLSSLLFILPLSTLYSLLSHLSSLSSLSSLYSLSSVLSDPLVLCQVDLTQACLTSSPKSYGAWHHRSWALDRMDRWLVLAGH